MYDVYIIESKLPWMRNIHLDQCQSFLFKEYTKTISDVHVMSLKNFIILQHLTAVIEVWPREIPDMFINDKLFEWHTNWCVERWL